MPLRAAWENKMSEKNGARVTAILLAAGKGTRMQSSRRKQFMELGGKMVLQWSFDTLKKSAIITDLVLVAPPEETEKVRNRYLTENGAAEEACVACKGLSEDESSAKDREGKPLAEKDGCDGAASGSFDHACVVAGGAERYNSVFNGIEAICWPCDYVFIHDGARPLLTEEMLEKLLAAVEQYGAAVAACPSKAIPERVLDSLTADVSLDGLTALRAENGNRLVFCFKDGSESVKRWEDRSRAESWTPEMKEAARQKSKMARLKAVP